MSNRLYVIVASDSGAHVATANVVRFWTASKTACGIEVGPRWRLLKLYKLGAVARRHVTCSDCRAILTPESQRSHARRG